MSTTNEAFLHLRRTPYLLKFIRAVPAPAGVVLAATALVDRYCYGWTLTNEGKPARLFYVRLDIARDGLGDFTPDPDFPRATAGDPKSIRLKQALLPIHDIEVPEIVAIDEEMQRSSVRKHWVEWHAARAEERRIERERVNLEHERKLREQQTRIIVTPRSRPKPKSFLARLFG